MTSYPLKIDCELHGHLEMNEEQHREIYLKPPDLQFDPVQVWQTGKPECPCCRAAMYRLTRFIIHAIGRHAGAGAPATMPEIYLELRDDYPEVTLTQVVFLFRELDKKHHIVAVDPAAAPAAMRWRIVQ